MTLFYAPDIVQNPFLNEEESLHCTKVLRLKAGDVVHVIDGIGGLYEVEIVAPHAKHTEVRILSVQNAFEKRPFRIHLAVAPTKNSDRFEWFIEKATEIGVDTITPLLCRYSERKSIKSERIEKILISASKQSLKAFVPKLNPMMRYDDFIESVIEPHRFIAHCYSAEKIHLLHACPPHADVVVLVGPEGDFSLEEVQLALQHNFQLVTLGNSRLRTETAGVIACHLVTVVNSL
ncbi:MAG TPA: 16S rRNA (uracil(1498)-N(3))-methyltransferase [Paludibacteraceae bacterium]|nr:16S rRNA (uracil(1498)-N(3))-methyltransferase [Paludibacteraceae bacterium]HQB69447.1 16S rRNA (uracil(1498)-N(3))-methyltransferase [Paludibacteraceae bacterium]